MKQCLLFLAILFLWVNLNAQNTCKCDEGEKLKPQVIHYADRGLTDSALMIYDIIKKQPGDACLILYYHGVAQLYMQKQDWAGAWGALSAAEKLLKKAGCGYAIVGKHYSITGYYYLNISKTDSSAWAYLIALEAAEKSDNKYLQARTYGDLGFTMTQAGDFLKSIEYNKKAIAAAKTSTDKPSQFILAIKTAHLADGYYSVYKNTGNKKYLDSCGATALDAIVIAKKAEDLNGLMESYNILSRYHNELKQYKQSIAYSDSMLMAHVPGFTNRFASLAWFNKAEVAKKENNLMTAAALADSSQYYAALFNTQAEIQSLQLVYNISKKLKNTDRSLAAFERMTMLKDSILGLEKNKAITELEKKYNQARNEKTIKELSQQKLIYALLGLGGLLVLGLVAFYFRQQALKNKQKILETEQRLNRARMNPHFFFNALTAMQRFALKENDGKALASSLSKFSNIMRETLESTYKEYVSIKQEIEFLKEYLEIQKMRFPQTFDYSLMVDGEIEPGDIMIPSMIIQPFIENSIEHGFAGIDYEGKIRVDFKLIYKTIEIIIHDNGKGFLIPGNKKNEHISRASQIVKDRIYLLNIKLKSKADFSIDNNNDGKGVVVKIHLPLIYTNENTDN